MALLTQIHRQLSNLLRSMTATLSPDVKQLGLLGALHQVVDRDLAGSLEDIDWQVEPAVEACIQTLLPFESEVLFFAAREALRNAARYGHLENKATLKVVIRATCIDGLSLIIEDNGGAMGTPAEATADADQMSSGQGLALHSALMAVMGGSLSFEHETGQFTRVTLSLPARPLYYQSSVVYRNEVLH